MQTGRYPFRNGHYKFASHQEADFVRPTVSQILRQQGYGTAVFGKLGTGIKVKKGQADHYDHTIEFSRDLERQGFGDIFHSGGKYEFPDGILLPIRTEETAILPNGEKLNYITQMLDGEIPA